ncbi:MAG: D-alanyl-D-alanine endopeptidase [Steroidobacteraceae bacterium]
MIHSSGRFFAGVLALILLATTQTGEAAKARSAGQPDVRSGSVLVMDRDNNVVYSRQADVVAPIASITKLMTALVVLDGKQSLDEVLEVTAADRKRSKGYASRLAIGTRLTRREFMRLALMSSENRAASTLGRNYPGGDPAFVRTMNLKAKALGMTRTRFVDPSGINAENVSTANDLVKLVAAAARSPVISDFSTTRKRTVQIGRGEVEFRNTNTLVGNKAWDITVQKTGYISEAGQCLVMQAMIDDRAVIFVLMNSWGKYTRVADAKRLRDWMGLRQRLAKD